MALISVRSKKSLALSNVLSPERYDPRRELDVQEYDVVELGEIAYSYKKMVKPSSKISKCLVLNTSDASEGMIVCRKQPMTGTEIGSTKKEIEPGDVIISRLRPYLRQVAFIDNEIPNAENAKILCSTEFFVLRSTTDLSIAFLIPFLLSNTVQKVLSASQEGGHHPRFSESTLLTLPIPKKLLSHQKEISKVVQNGICLYRDSEEAIANMVQKSDDILQNL